MPYPDGPEARIADLEDRQSRIPDHDTRANAADAERMDHDAYLAYWLGRALPSPAKFEGYDAEGLAIYSNVVLS